MASLPSSNVLCRYFLENTCRFGDKCKFVHDVKLGILDDECRFFRVDGRCRYGRQCFYDHVRHHKNGLTELVSKGKRSLERDLARLSITSEESDPPEPGSTEPGRLPLCKEFEVAGSCASNECSAIHGDICKTCGKYAIHPFNRYLNLIHESECKPREATVPTLSAELLRQSADLTCGVCLDVVYEKLGKGSKRFGILSDCCHVFCVECVREWRKSSGSAGRKTCPMCRTPSDTMVASVFHVKGGEAKDLLLRQHREKLKKNNSGAGNHAAKFATIYPAVDPNGDYPGAIYMSPVQVVPL